MFLKHDRLGSRLLRGWAIKIGVYYSGFFLLIYSSSSSESDSASSSQLSHLFTCEKMIIFNLYFSPKHATESIVLTNLPETMPVPFLDKSHWHPLSIAGRRVRRWCLAHSSWQRRGEEHRWGSLGYEPKPVETNKEVQEWNLRSKHKGI